MSSQPYIGEIAIYPYNFAPRNWSYCEGQLMPISSYSTLFALLGTTYGGDGRTNFALPDLRGRTVVGVGSGPGLTPIQLGQKGGTETTTQVVAHSHTAALYGEKEAPDGNNPAGKFLGQSNIYTTPTDKTDKQMFADAIVVASTGQPAVDNRSPFLGLHYCIAMDGIFPSRN